MPAPRLEIRLDRIEHNTRTLVDRLQRLGISVTGVTKATLGAPAVARAMLRGGVVGLGDSRIENIERLRAGGVGATMTLIRSPMLSQVERVVAHADVSLNSEPAVIEALGAAAVAQGLTHAVVLMVELGDLREGIMPGDLPDVVAHTLRVPGIELRGIGTNLACQSGATPDERNMGALGALVASIESSFGIEVGVVSGGNSANLDWAFGGADPGRIDDLRLGESILLGCEPLRRTPIVGLHTDAMTLVGEVIESKVKPSRAWGEINETAFGAARPDTGTDTGTTRRVIVALGRQDTDPDGLTPPDGMTILGASSDHLVLDVGAADCPIGAALRFGVNYAALLRSATSPFVMTALSGAPAPDLPVERATARLAEAADQPLR